MLETLVKMTQKTSNTKDSSRKIRVLTIVSGLAIGEPLGGAERFGMEVACHLDTNRFEPIVCGFWQRDGLAERYWINYLKGHSIEVFSAVERGKGFGPSRYVKGLRSIATHFQTRPVDIIHSHFQLGSITAIILKSILNSRALVRTAHGSTRWEWSNTLIGFMCRQIFTKWMFPLTFDAEVAVSKAAVDSLNQRLSARVFKRKTILLHNAISPNRFDQDSEARAKRCEFGLSDQDLVVGSVGRLSAQKGYIYLVEAASAVIAKVPNAKFIIIGNGELKDELIEKTEQLGLSESIIFAGARQDAETLYRMMDIFVLPSLWEGLPTVVLESMASGIPVIATDIPGTRELIRMDWTGWLAQPRDPISLATYIIEALSTPQKRATIAQRALQEVIPRFSIEHVAKQYEKLYCKLVAP
jgi:glycosyltransferase involved in cell wall biosynthesis